MKKRIGKKTKGKERRLHRQDEGISREEIQRSELEMRGLEERKETRQDDRKRKMERKKN